MPITIYGTDWCADTRRTRAFLASQGVRSTFIDIEARPELARGLVSPETAPIVIPVVIFEDGTRLDEPDNAQLLEALAEQDLPQAIRHRTSLNTAERRFEQYRNDVLVATATYEERDGSIVVTGLQHHGDHNDASAPPTVHPDTIERLTTGLVEIVRRSGRDIDIDPSAPDLPEASGIEGPTDGGDVRPEDPEPSPTCPLATQFQQLWSDGGDHRAATDLARHLGLGRLAAIKALHEWWEMPLTADAAFHAFGEAGIGQLAAMFHTLNWIIEQNPTSTIAELQAFDDATGVSIKTQALSLADRPRDTIALVDRMGPGLHLHPIDESAARDLAASAIREQDGQLRIQDQSTMRHAFGWMFFYQSARFLETGDYSAMISGNAPLLVDRFTGAIWITDTEHRPDVYVSNYLGTGNPLASPYVGLDT